MPLEVTTPADTIRSRMQALWRAHIVLTRQFILAYEEGSRPGTNKYTQLLMKNQEDIGNAVGAYFGRPAGAKLTALLKEHIVAAADYVGAAYSHSDKGKFNAATRLMANVDKVARFMSGLTVYWPKIAVKKALTGHIMHTKCEVDARVAHDEVGDQACWVQVQLNAKEIADFFAAGIIQSIDGRTTQLMRIPKGLRVSMLKVHTGKLV